MYLEAFVSCSAHLQPQGDSDGGDTQEAEGANDTLPAA